MIFLYGLLVIGYFVGMHEAVLLGEFYHRWWFDSNTLQGELMKALVGVCSALSIVAIIANRVRKFGFRAVRR